MTSQCDVTIGGKSERGKTITNLIIPFHCAFHKTQYANPKVDLIRALDFRLIEDKETTI